jgi:hypothetical protein
VLYPLSYGGHRRKSDNIVVILMSSSIEPLAKPIFGRNSRSEINVPMAALLVGAKRSCTGVQIELYIEFNQQNIK